jgi:receptor protein-tyrosine kinase/non-specific protein-tyrosine kinase
MSRIEKALEKAVRLRETGAALNPDENAAAPVLAEGEPVTFTTENPYLVTFREPASPIAEEYRKLKTAIMRQTKKDFRNTLTITSPLSGEGKSITCVNLAVMLAREYGQTVLLVDADLRRPMLQDYLGISPDRGLSDCIADNVDAAEAIVKTGIPKLSFLSSGRRVDNPAELVSSFKTKNFLTELKHRYPDRYVLIDTPPLLPFAETQALALLADGVVFVVREGVASPKGITDALELLKGAAVLGVVYNDASSAGLNGGYHNYYYARYYYGKDRQPAAAGKQSCTKHISDSNKNPSI